MKRKKYIVDTTLRDGEQKPGCAMNRDQKIAIARLMDEAGIYQIEAGIPAMGYYEIEMLLEISDHVKSAKISTWNRLNPDDIKSSFACRPDIIHISVPVSYSQIYVKLNKNKNWVIKSLLSCVDMAASEGYEVTVGFEDASRADITFMAKLAIVLKKAGVSRIRFADTVGILFPSRTGKMIKDLIDYTGIKIEMHAHNDLGMAIANSIEAAKAGADFIDTTVFGIGERAGNCDFGKFIYASIPSLDLNVSRQAARDVEEKTGEILNTGILQ